MSLQITRDGALLPIHFRVTPAEPGSRDSYGQLNEPDIAQQIEIIPPEGIELTDEEEEQARLAIEAEIEEAEGDRDIDRYLARRDGRWEDFY